MEYCFHEEWVWWGWCGERKMISDKEWLREIGKWDDWEDESYGERVLRNYMRIHLREPKTEKLIKG